ncbi:Twin-arginine translocation protein TatC [Bacillus thermotolerans]|uniref:Sec-independent protein translocase protein TatC n=2 Tax=Bacillus thermotolerans TaxID=1221996 RepID=A0A0F5HKL6_BACTR|nr:Twin-arginine translocation protein TatC [Bacillus thermotolerans]KKB35442.1 Twin-arginine translocation protein TatC [Bacillus thermotolerans]KKB40083.1 Twin-arginine translocation protein TatC [Bacillus thermotolerans]
MTIHEHISELRKRLLVVVVFFFLAMIAGLLLAEPVIHYLQHADEAQELTMNAFRVTDPLKIYFQMAFVIAFILTSPMILYQLWAFISPGLLEKERKVTLSYIPVSLLLFLAGLSFSYFILFPYIIHFMMRLSGDLNIEQVIGINEYFQFLFQITIPFGILFQLPIVVLFLTRLGIVTPMFLSQIRRYAYFVLLVIAALITPPDVISHLMVTVPLLVLYEVSIWVSKIGYKKVLKAEIEAANR